MTDQTSNGNRRPRSALSVCWRIALLAVLIALTSRDAIAAGEDDSPPIQNPMVGVDFSTLLDPADITDTVITDPQPAGFSFTGVETEGGPPRLAASGAMSRPAELSDSPMAPLPPAIVAGPIGIAFAAYTAWRVKRRGGRI